MYIEAKLVTEILPVNVLEPIRPVVHDQDNFCFCGQIEKNMEKIEKIANDLPGCFLYYSFMDDDGSIYLTKKHNEKSDGFYITDFEIKMRLKKDIYDCLNSVTITTDINELNRRFSQFENIHDFVFA